MVRQFGPAEARVVERDDKVLFIHLRGRFRALTAGGDEIKIASKRVRALLVFLCLTVGFKATRQDIVPRLWKAKSNASDELDEDDCNGGPTLKNLRQLLVTLREQLGAEAVQAVRIELDAISLDPTLVWIDVFAEMGAIADIEHDMPCWVVENRQLLAGFAPVKAPFDEWLKGEIRDYATGKGTAVSRRAQSIEAKMLPVERQIADYRAMTECVPDDEELCQRLMELLSTTGRAGITEISRIFERCKTAVEVSRDEPLHEQTVAAYRRACTIIQVQCNGDQMREARQSEPVAAALKLPAECRAPRDAPIRLDETVCIGLRPLLNLSSDPALNRLTVELNRNILTDLGIMARPFKLILLPAAGAPPERGQSLCEYIITMTLEVERRSSGSMVLINITTTSCEHHVVTSANRVAYPLVRLLEYRRPMSARVANTIYFDLITEHALRLEGVADPKLSVSELVLMGMAMLARRNTPSNVWAAMRYFGSALVRDSRNVDALAGAGHVYHRLATQPAFSDNPGEAARRGLACIETAIDRDRGHIRANYVSGLLNSVLGQPERAAATFDRVLEISTHMPTLFYRSYNRCFLDQPIAAREELRQNIEMLRDEPSVPIYFFFQAVSEVHCGDIPGAIQTLRRSLHSDPSYGSARIWLAACEQLNGNVAEARRQMEGFRAACPDYTIAEFDANWGSGRTQNHAHLSRSQLLTDALNVLELPQAR